MMSNCCSIHFVLDELNIYTRQKFKNPKKMFEKNTVKEPHAHIPLVRIGSFTLYYLQLVLAGSTCFTRKKKLSDQQEKMCGPLSLEFLSIPFSNQ